VEGNNVDGGCTVEGAGAVKKLAICNSFGAPEFQIDSHPKNDGLLLLPSPLALPQHLAMLYIVCYTILLSSLNLQQSNQLRTFQITVKMPTKRKTKNHSAARKSPRLLDMSEPPSHSTNPSEKPLESPEKVKPIESPEKVTTASVKPSPLNSIKENVTTKTTPCGIPLPNGVMLERGKFVAYVFFFPRNTTTSMEKKVRVSLGICGTYVEGDSNTKEIVEEAIRVVFEATNLRDSMVWESIDAFKEGLNPFKENIKAIRDRIGDIRSTPCGIPLPNGVILDRGTIVGVVHFYQRHTTSAMENQVKVRLGTFGTYVEGDSNTKEIVEEAGRVVFEATNLRDSMVWESVDAFKEELNPFKENINAFRDRIGDARSTPCGIILPKGVWLKFGKIEATVYFFPRNTTIAMENKIQVRLGTFGTYVEGDSNTKEIVEEAGRVVLEVTNLRASMIWESFDAFEDEIIPFRNYIKGFRERKAVKERIGEVRDERFKKDRLLPSRTTPCGIELPRGVTLFRDHIRANIYFEKKPIYLGEFGRYINGASENEAIVKEAGRVYAAARELRDSKEWDSVDDFVEQLAIQNLRKDHRRSESEIERDEALATNQDELMASITRNDGTRCLLERQQVGDNNNYRFSESMMNAYKKYSALFAEGSIEPVSLSQNNEDPITSVPTLPFAEGSIEPVSLSQNNEDPITSVPTLPFAEGSIELVTLSKNSEDPITPDPKSLPHYAEV
jgi:hypothetical protein